MQNDKNETTITNYKLRAFSNSADPDFIKAIKLYSSNISATSLTDTNEIAYCLDNYSNIYPASKFHVAGFYQNKILIGYCQFIYIGEEKLVIIDYIVIDDKSRGLSTFYTFMDKVKEYLTDKGFEFKFIVGEINIQNNDKSSVPQKARALIKLLKATNFGEIKSNYYQPMLGADNYESFQNSILMLYPADQYQEIKKETYAKIIETIYFKHYERWYKLFLPEESLMQYSKHLHELYRKVSEKLTSIKSIPVESEEVSFEDGKFSIKNESTSTKKTALLIFGFLGLLMVLILLSVSLKKLFSIDTKDQMYILITTGLIYLILLSFFSDKASKILNKVLEKLIDKIT